MDPIVSALLQHGPFGLVCAALLIWNLRLQSDNKATLEKLLQSEERRIQDAQAFTVRALQLQDKFSRMLEKVRIMVETLVSGRRGSLPSLHAIDSDPPEE